MCFELMFAILYGGNNRFRPYQHNALLLQKIIGTGFTQLTGRTRQRFWLKFAFYTKVICINTYDRILDYSNGVMGNPW